MKHQILAGLSVLTLSMLSLSAPLVPASAVEQPAPHATQTSLNKQANSQDEQDHQAMLDELDKKFEQERQEMMTEMNARLDRMHQEMVQIINQRFQQAAEERLNR